MMKSLSDLTCPGCGQSNECAVAAGRSAATCWCMEPPTRLPLPTDNSACYCAICLRALAGKPVGGERATDAK